MAPRWQLWRDFHAGKAAFAAVTAELTSAWEAEWILSETREELAGLWIVIVVLVEEGMYYKSCVSFGFLVFLPPSK